MEPRAEDLALVARLRTARESAVGLASQGNIASVLSSQNEADQFVYLVKLLDVHPQLGKVAGRRLMQTMSLNQFTRVSDLSPMQVSIIVHACEESA